MITSRSHQFFTKFHEKWRKIVDFSLMPIFRICPVFFAQTLENDDRNWATERHINISCFLRRKLAQNKLAPQTQAEVVDSRKIHKMHIST